jgi:chromosome segregation ATPase
MRKIKEAVAAVVLATAVAGGTYAFFASPLVPTAQAHLRDHPRLEGAYSSLKEAKEYLESAPSDFRGHKAEAIHAINEAMHQISICVEEVEERKPSIDAAPEGTHEKLRIAREHLKEGREYLNESKIDFHGHKGEAIRAIDEAIHQINVCLEE